MFKLKLIVNLLCLILILVLAILALLILIIFSINSSPFLLPAKYAAEVCETPECLYTAAYLHSSLNESVNPCDDFYEFACGGWRKRNPRPPERTRWATFDVLQKSVIDKLRTILDKENGTDELSQQAVDLFHGCLDKNQRDSLGYKSLKNLLTEFGWPLIDTKWTDEKYDWRHHYATINRKYAASYVLSNWVDADLKNNSLQAFYLYQPSFGVGRTHLINSSIDNNKTINAYRNLITEIAIELASQNNFKPNKDEIEDLIRFEMRLANISSKSEDLRDEIKVYGEGRISLKQLKEKYDFDFSQMASEVFKDTNITISDDEKVFIVYDQKYFKNLTRVMNETKPRTIANYMSWRLVQTYSSYTTSKMDDLHFEFAKVTTGAKEKTPAWECCASLVKNTFVHVVGKLYIDEHFPKSVKKNILSMIGFLKGAFLELLKNNTWMDHRTKEQAKIKLNNMIDGIAYPDFYNNLTKIKEFYKGLDKVDKKQYFKSITLIDEWSQRKSLKKLKEKVGDRNEIEWPSPATVNAYSNLGINRITLLAGILASPFYTFGAPISVNLGGIGEVIGHEITHGFDDMGSVYDKLGNLRMWWTNQSRAEFNKRKQCMVDQYSAYRDKQVNINLNGANSIGENIADNGGLRQAFEALKSYLKTGKSLRLPASMKKYTSEQLLFISTAHTYCDHITDQELTKQILYDTHVPSRFRVWGPVSNSHDFAEAFGCKTGDRMNPKDKCVLW